MLSFTAAPARPFAPKSPHYSATEAAFHYLFSLCSQIQYMTGWTQGSRPSLCAGAEVTHWGWGWRICGKSLHPKAVRLKNSSIPNGDIDKGVSCFFWYFFALLFSKRAWCSILFTHKFFCFLFEWCVSTAFKVWESDELWILCLNSCGLFARINGWIPAMPFSARGHWGRFNEQRLEHQKYSFKQLLG